MDATHPVGTSATVPHFREPPVATPACCFYGSFADIDPTQRQRPGSGSVPELRQPSICHTPTRSSACVAGQQHAVIVRSKLLAAVTLLLLTFKATGKPLAADNPYMDRMSQRQWSEYPGGQYKASTSANLPTTTIAGAVFQLKAGGLRELHWHNVHEWAYVIEGSCRATLLDEGMKAPVDTWDFLPGDVWYFPANTAHTILGLSPAGCTYVVGWDAGAFDERDSFSASSWAAALAPGVLAQGLGITEEAAQQLQASTPAAGTFLAQGDPAEMEALTAPPVHGQFPTLIHRFPLSQNTYSVSASDGSYVNKADMAVFPVSSRMSGALVYLAPGSMRQLHWHLNIDEWQYVINGTVEAGVFLKPGSSYVAQLGPGDVGFAPMGSAHYLRNPTSEPAYVVLVFNDGRFTDIELPNFLGTVPSAWAAASLNVSAEAVSSIHYNRAGFALPLPSPSKHRPARRPVHAAAPLPRPISHY